MTTTGLASRIAYRSVYGLLWVILIVLLLIVPGDFIQQTLTVTHQNINLIVISIVYVITILVVLFVYFLRLYVTRTVLASIPKAWIPVDKGDVKREVHNMVAESQGRSAAIAWQARPRVITPPHTPDESAGSAVEDKRADDVQVKETRRSLQLFKSRTRASMEDRMGIALQPSRPIWGQVEHHGWGSPASPDLANLQYTAVLAELPNLIEAKAVSQAPPDPDSAPTAPLLDAEAVMLLQRAPNMTIRSYTAHLTSLGVLQGSQDIVRFLDLYERVRFCGRPMSNATFRKLMHLFAELLRAMQPLHPNVLYDDNSSYRHIDDDAPQDSHPTTRTPSPSLKSTTSIRSFERDQGSVRTRPRNSSAATRGQYRTAPTTPRSRAEATFASRSPSSASIASSFTQSRRPYPASQTSSLSLGSGSGSGSVIRLATVSDIGDLPYVLRLADTI